jgi:hypothetical protein
MATVFCDSFAHYDTAGIPLKYSTAGGAIENNPAHIRTGPQSLRIQSGDAPSIINFKLPADTTVVYSAYPPQYSNFAVGVAYQAGALNGNVVELWLNLNLAPAPAERQLFIRLNANGSVSLMTGAATVLATSAAGVVTAGAFYYYTLTADLVADTAVLNVTDSLLHSTDVISISGFATSRQHVDSVVFGGPAGPDHGWVNDFYFQDLSDASSPPFAPNIYAVVPTSDGTPLAWDWILFGSWQPVGSPHFGLVNPVPENEAQGIHWDDGYGPTPPFFINRCAETYLFGCAGLPSGRLIQGIQSVFLWEYVNVIGAMPIVFPATIFQDNIGATQTVPNNGISTQPGMPFMFIPQPSDLDPFTGLPWLMADWKNGNRQAGPDTFTLM